MVLQVFPRPLPQAPRPLSGRFHSEFVELDRAVVGRLHRVGTADAEAEGLNGVPSIGNEVGGFQVGEPRKKKSDSLLFLVCYLHSLPIKGFAFVCIHSWLWFHSPIKSG